MSEETSRIEISDINTLESLKSKEKLEKVWELYGKLRKCMMRGFSEIQGTELYTGGNDIGKSSAENTPLAALQLIFTMAQSLHPLVEELSRIDYKSLQSEKAEEEFKKLIDGKVLENLGIIVDLGCGHEPYYPRLCRLLGAQEVWTVDVISAKDFNRQPQKTNPQVIAGERKNHIQLDLNNPTAVEIILSRIGRDNIDLVTEAYLSTGGPHEDKYYISYKGEEIAMKLLKKGGVYFNPETQELKIK